MIRKNDRNGDTGLNGYIVGRGQLVEYSVFDVESS